MIETGAMLDPLEPTAFVTEVTFTAAGQFTVRRDGEDQAIGEKAAAGLFVKLA